MDIRSIRIEKLKMSEREFCDSFGIELKVLKEWEHGANFTSDAMFNIIPKIQQKTDMSFEDILHYRKQKPRILDKKFNWEKKDFKTSKLLDYLNETINSKDSNISEEQCQRYLVDIKQGLEASLMKPSVSVVGKSDADKTILVNNLLGVKKLPIPRELTTSLVVYIKHLNDRPVFMKNDVWIFADSLDGETYWNVKRLYDESYCKKWKLESGKIGTLQEFGAKPGNERSNSGSAIVFIDSPFLLNCDIVILPSFESETGDDLSTVFKRVSKTDILIYLSQAADFMRSEDCINLRDSLRWLPVWEKKGENYINVLENLFVVAFHSHQSASNEDENKIKRILTDGYKKFSQTLAMGYWEKRERISGYDYTDKKILKRFFTYSTDTPLLCKDFKVQLNDFVEKFPTIANNKTQKYISEFVNNRGPQLIAEIKTYEKMSEDINKYRMLLQCIKENEPKRMQENNERRKVIEDRIKELKEETKVEFFQYYAKVVNTDAIEKRIKDKEIRNEEEDVRIFANQLQDEIKENCNKILERKTKCLNDEIKNYLKEYNKSIKRNFDEYSIEGTFDADYEFTIALAKRSFFGGLGAFATGCAVILASESFALISAGVLLFGVGVIGTVVGIPVAAYIGFQRLFGSSWEKNVAKKLVTSHENKRIREGYTKGIDDYWKNIKDNFTQAASNIEERWIADIKRLEDEVENYNEEDIFNKQESLKGIKNFFDAISLLGRH